MHQLKQFQQFHSLLAGFRHSLAHIVITLLAIGIAFSLPIAAKYVLYDWWPEMETDANLLLATEVGLSAALILLFNASKTVWDSRRMIAAAKRASLVYAVETESPLARWKTRRLLQRSSVARDVFVLTLTGFDTFAEPKSPFNGVLATAYEIRVMLLNPASETAMRRVNAIPDQDVNLQSLREEITASIAYLATLHKLGKRITLKFYEHEPIWKVVVLGDYVWVQHCHHGFELKRQPEYVFALQGDAPRQGFYVPFYTYFLDHWNEPHHPEYDFETHELVYRDDSGNETRRVPLHLLNGTANLPTSSRQIAMDNPSIGTIN